MSLVNMASVVLVSFFNFTSVLYIEISLVIKQYSQSMLPFYLCPFGNKWYAFLFTHLINPFL